MYKNKDSYTDVEQFADPYSSIESTPYFTEQKSTDYRRQFADFTSAIAQDDLKNSRKTKSILSNCRSISVRLSSTSLSQKSQGECESSPIPKTIAAGYRNILSPNVFVQVDLLQYLRSKLEKLSIREVWPIETELKINLQCKELPQCYIPYAEVLRKILKCWSYLSINAQVYMEAIRDRRSPNIDGSFSLPEEISSSDELSQLYSSDILNDHNPDRRLLFIFLDMSQDDIDKLKTQLQIFLNKSSKYSKRNSYSNDCVRYAQAIFDFFSREFIFESIKRYVTEIKSRPSIQTSNQIL